MKKLCLLLITTALLTVGCSEQDEFGKHNLESGFGKITLSGDIDQVYQTRISESGTGFANGDQIGVYFVNYDGETPGTLLSRGNQGDNVRHTYDEVNNTWNSAYDVYWKDRKTHIDIYGYYPFMDNVSTSDGKTGSQVQSNLDNVNAWAFEVKADQSTEAANGELGGYEQSDLLWGKVQDVAPTDQVIRLPLRHRMSTARIDLIEGTGFANGEFAQLEKTAVIKNTRRNATVDLATGSVTATGDIQSTGIVPYKYGDQFRAIIVPQTVAAGEILFAFSLGGKPYTFKKTEAFEFMQGKMHNFSIKIDKKADTGDYKLTLIGESITAWENDAVSHDATMKEYVVIKSTPGELKDAIIAANKDYTKLRNLKIIGEINVHDFDFMRDEMDNLTSLNMKEVIIKESPFEPGYGNGSPEYTIPRRALYQKRSLTSIVLPDKLKSIESEAFSTCSSLSGSLIIPEGVTYIGPAAFFECGNLTGQLSLPSTLEQIGEKTGYIHYWDGTFKGCKFSCELKLPEKLKVIGMGAFYDCKNIYGEIKLPSGLEALGNGAFHGMSNVTGSIDIPQGVSYIPDDCFDESGFNGTLTLHDGITAIGANAFANTNLKGELYLPRKLEVIGDGVFYNCDFSGELILPQAVKTIGEKAFAYNWRLMGVLEFPENLISIGAGAFAECRMLEGLVFNEALENINAAYVHPIGYVGAFENCYGIGSIVCKGTIPPHIMGSVFNGVAKDNFTLEVPESAVQLYQTSDGWREFKRIAAHRELVCRPSIACAVNTQSKQRLVLNAEGDWEVASKPDWCELSQMSGSKKTELTLTIKQMASGSEMREGEIVFRLKDKDYTHSCRVRQYDYQYGEDEIITMQKATRGNNGGINIVIVGDGYDAKDISEGQYMQDMQEEIEYFFGIEPYKTYRDYFNVYTAIALSQESGIGTINTIRYAKFETTYTGGVGLRADYDALFDYAKRMPTVSNGNIDQTLIIVVPNSTDYGGICQMWESGAAIAFCPKSTYGYPLDSRGVIQHEAGGHGFGKLGDEYIYHNAFIDFCTCTCCPHVLEFMGAKSLGWYDNLELTGKMHQVGWSHLIFDDRYSDLVDIFEGGYMHTRGVFRSEQNSCMNNDIPYYSTISRESIVKRIKRYAGETFSFEDFVANDKREAGMSTRALDAPWMRTSAHGYQHEPVIHKGSPRKSKR